MIPIDPMIAVGVELAAIIIAVFINTRG